MKEKKSSDTNFEKGKKIASDFLNSVKSDEVISTAQKVISSAVNVLEEEIAAGILAAKNIEKKVINVDDVRNNADDLMNRIRRDTHEAVDLFLDAISALTQQVSNLSSSIKTKDDTSQTEAKTEAKTSKSTTFKEEKKQSSDIDDDAETALMLSADHPLAPGESTTLHFTLSSENADTKDNYAKFDFDKSNFFGPNKEIIYSRAIKILPPKVSLSPGEEKEIEIQIRVPKNAGEGKYNCFITDNENSLVNIVLHIEVVKKAKK